jgi:predicted MFS family arabinose efflux permease
MTDMAAPHWARTGYQRVLSAQALSSLGDRISYVVVPFALLGLGFSVGTVALVLGARTVAYAVVVLWGGVLADRISCVRLMVASDAVRFTTQLLTAGLVFFRVDVVALFVATQLVFGLAEACFKPAAGRLIPDIVPDDHLEKANGYYNAVVNFGMVFGPVLGGLLIALGDDALGLVIDAVTFAASAVILIRVRHTRTLSEPDSHTSVRSEIADGWRALLSQRWLLVAIVASGAFHLLALSAVFALGPAYAEDHLNGASGWGVLVAAFGSGGIVGGLLSSRFRTGRPGVAILLSLIALSSQPFVLASGLPYPVILAWQFLNGIALAYFSVVYGTAMQRFVPRETLGRVGSFDEVTTSALMPLGYLMLGVAATALGPQTAMQLASGAAMLCCALLLAAPSIRHMKGAVAQDTSVPTPDPSRDR